MIECTDCGWRGEDAELVNTIAYGEDYYVDGEDCPICGGEVEDVTAGEEE